MEKFMKIKLLIMVVFIVLVIVLSTCLMSCSTIDEHQHRLEYYPMVESTCSKQGNLEYWKCLDCQMLFENEDASIKLNLEDIILPLSSNHEVVFVGEITNTCVTDGIYDHWHCLRCGKNFIDESCSFILDDEVIPAEGHKLNHIARVEASCGEEGYEAYWECLACNKKFKDNEGLEEIELKDLKIPATGLHQMEDEWRMVKEPTREEEGIKKLKCKNCEYHETASVNKINYEYSDFLRYSFDEELNGYVVTGIYAEQYNQSKEIAIHAVHEGLPVVGVSSFVGSFTGEKEVGAQITKVIIPETVNYIEDKAFYKLTNLKSIETVGEESSFLTVNNVLYDKDMSTLVYFPICNNQSTFTIPSTVKKIGNYSMANAKYISVVNCPSTLEVVGEGAFEYSSLSIINLSNNLKRIEGAAFFDCNNLAKVNNIPDTIEYVGGSIFNIHNENDTLDLKYYGNCVYYGNDTNPYLILIRHRYVNSNLSVHPDTKVIAAGIGGLAFPPNKEFTIPNGVEHLSGSIFGLGAVDIINIGDGVKTIEEGAFSNIVGLKEINVSENNKYFTSKNGVLYSKDFTELLCYPVEKEGEIYEIDVNCKRIAYKAFEGNSGNDFLQTITLPNTLESIGGYAFSNCNSLTNIVIPDSVTSIDEYAFFGCANLINIVIPNSVTSLGDSIFAYCRGLKNATIGNGVTSLGYGVFSSCTSLTSVTIGNSVTSIGDGAFRGCISLIHVAISDKVNKIGVSTFFNCRSLTIYCEADSKPSGWASDWNSSNCPVVWDCNNNDIADDGYKYIVIDGLRYGIKDEIAKVAGNNAEGDIVIPSSIEFDGVTYKVISIGDVAFEYCSGLTSIVIPNSIINIGAAAFRGCSGLISIVIPNSVTNIGGSAFRWCRNLKSVTIGNGVTSIGIYAFA